MSTLPPYSDHVQMWQNELQAWVPNDIFDAHIHLGPADAMGPITDQQRRKEALTTFTHYTAEELFDFYPKLYAGKNVRGIIAFPFPLREVNYQRANDYIAELMRRDGRVKGFVLSNPHNTRETIRQYESAKKAGTHYLGVKPYYDLVGKTMPYCVLQTAIAEFVPEDLLEFMESERLLLMLHTGRIGMGDPECQQWVMHAVEKYPHVKIFLAHMGRYYELYQYEDFMKTDVMNHPSLYLEMSSASLPEVYRLTLSRSGLGKRLVFGSDMPFGGITGVEYADENTTSTFITRDEYEWTDREVSAKFAKQRLQLTYNTYHVIRALKTAIEGLGLSEAEKQQLKRDIFFNNAVNLIAGVEA